MEEASCLIYLICVCLYMYIVVVSILFVGGLMSYLPYLCLFVHVYSGGIYFVCFGYIQSLKEECALLFVLVIYRD